MKELRRNAAVLNLTERLGTTNGTTKLAKKEKMPVLPAPSRKICGPARNRTWIWSFGNSHTIHCTTRPNHHFIKPPTLVANIFTAMASKITPKNFLTANNPACPKSFAI